MPQLIIHLTPELEKALTDYMRLRRVKTKSDAVRLALLEAVDRERRGQPAPRFSQWLGLCRQAPESPNPRFHSDEDLWS
ncbi:MAG: hypothetical protein QOH06_2585 [Acidobacteriota bacterium]|jgi:hypothetical protein|nr:hypothetical protein [Acidobacteriota bacterium]